MSPNDCYRCDACGASFLARHLAQNRFLDPVCPVCASLLITRVATRDERVNAAVIESNCL